MSDQQSPQNDRLLRAVKGLPVDRPPMWVMRQAGRYLPEYNEAKGKRDFFDICRSPEIASTITLQPIERFLPLIDAAIIFSDILVVPQALGMEVQMIEKRGPVFPDPLRSPADLARLRTEVDVVRELGYVFEAIRETRRKLAGRVPLFGFVGAPWTLMAYMVEGGGSKMFVEIKRWIFRWPEESRALLQRVTDIVVEFLARQVEAGAQIIQVFDSWAGELSPHDFRLFSLPYLRQISARLPQRLAELGLPRVPMTVFAKGAWYALDELCDSGYDCVGLDWTHDPAAAVAIARGRVTLQGNLDPSTLYGGREAITKGVERMVHGFAGAKGRYVVNLGHGITPGVDPEDLRWFFEECVRVGLEVYKDF